MATKLFIGLIFAILSPWLVTAQGSGTALDFSDNEYIDCGPATRNFTFPFGFECWIWINSGVSIGYPIYNADVVPTNPNYYTMYAIVNLAGRVSLSYCDGTGTGAGNRRTIQSTNGIPTDEWVHVAAFFDDPNTGRVYINGIEEMPDYIGSGALAIVNGSAPGITTIGYHNSLGSGGYMKGKLDELRIWNTTRTETQVKDFMCTEIDPATPGLEMYTRFNDGAGSMLADLSGNGHDGTFVGTPEWEFSGAAIGDESAYNYPASWAGESVSLTGPDGSVLSTLNPIPTAVQSGMQVYRVDNPPNTAAGLSAGVESFYYGVYGVNINSYDADFDFAVDTCYCDVSLFTRNDNASVSWNSLLSDSVPACQLSLLEESMTGNPYRSEYIYGIMLPEDCDTADIVPPDTVVIDPPDTTVVEPVDSICLIAFPNAFSPNNDLLNDRWGPKYSCPLIEDYTLLLFNRWGELIFSTRDPEATWDGTYRGKQQEIASYLWVLQYQANGISRVEKGTVTLVR